MRIKVGASFFAEVYICKRLLFPQSNVRGN